MPITVRDAMSIGALRACRVVAGHKGLERPIEFITVMEVPDVIQWLKGRELLLTSLYPIKDDPEAQQRLVPQLMEVGSAGIAIKTHRFIEGIPTAILESAEKLGFPVIEIAEEVAYIDILTPLMKEILSRNAHQENGVETFFQWATEMAMEGKGLPPLVSAVSQYVGNPVVLESDIPLIPNLCGPYQLNALSAGDYHALKQSRRAIRVQRDVNGLAQPCVICPILIHGEMQGVLSCLEVNRPLGHMDLVVLERVVPLLALEFLKEKSRFEVDLKYKNDFLNDILHGNLVHEEEVATKARRFGWELSGSNRVMVFNVDGFSDVVAKFQQDEVLIQEYKNTLLRGIDRAVQSSKHGIVIGMRSDLFVVVRPQAPDEGESTVRDWMEEVQRRLRQQQGTITYTIGISRPYTGVSGLHPAFQEAVRAVELGRPLHGRDTNIFFSDLGVYRLFHATSGKRDMEVFYRETIAPIEIYDSAHGTQLMESLDRFFERNYGLTDAAESLFIHVNTLKYRLQKVEEITGCRLADAEGRLKLQLGMKLKHYRDTGGLL